MNSTNDVVCIGSAAIDSVFLVEEFPSPDQISLARWCKVFCGGSSANVSVGMSRLGLHSGLVAKVGRDLYGVKLLNTLISEGVDIKTVTISGKTARTVVLVNQKGEKMIVADTGCVLKTEKELPVSYVTNAKALYIGECFLSVAEKAVKMAHIMGMYSFLRVKNVHVSPDLDVEKVISQADFVIMNEKTHSLFEDDHDNFIITRGAKGCYYVKEDTTVEGFTVTSVDTTGAGDAFCAGFIHHILKGYAVREALEFATAAGAAATTRYGAMDSMPSKKEVDSLLTT